MRGRCLHLDPDLFFPQTGVDAAPALSVCRGCPVRDTCLAVALDRGEVDGVWGATTHDERRRMRLAWTADVVEAA
ncbi:MAG TPA: WhiB family transcriptional regulator [Frankiaceae bacterium]